MAQAAFFVDELTITDNATMVLPASGCRISMVVGAIYHQGSSLFVILNSMRLLLAMKRRSIPGAKR